MSVTLNCCQGLTIRELSCGPCARTSKRNGPGTRVMMIHDTSVDLSVVTAPNRRLDSLGVDEPAAAWDFMDVDNRSRMVMLAGTRMHELSNNRFAGGDPNACAGLAVVDVFPKSVSDILLPLIDMALAGKSPQLHTIYQSQSLTLFAYPLYNEVSDVIGAHIVYRPTSYDKRDIQTILTENERALRAEAGDQRTSEL